MLAACGSGEGGGAAVGTTTDPGAGSGEAAAAGGLTLLRVFALEQAAGVPLRLPLAFADADGAPTDDVPAAITVTAVSPSGVAGEPVEVARHGLTFTAASAAVWLAEQEQHHPMWRMARRALPAEDWAAARAETLVALEAHNDDPAAFRTTSPYVVVVADRR